MGIEKKKETHFAQNLFFYAACVQNSNCFRKEKYISIEWRKMSSVTMPSDISYANSCVNVFFLYSDVQYVYLCTEAADRNVNKYVVYL